MQGILYLVATPIGNMEDLSIRAIKTLGNVDLLLCEDTRHTGLLIEWIKSNLQILNSKFETNSKFQFLKPKLLSYQEYNELQRIPEIILLLKQGRNVGLVSNAGTPTISDPGFKLVRECIRENISVVSIPGPSALISALVTSGLPTDKFTFLGYFPEKQGKVDKLLEEMKSFKGTLIFYESPYRIVKSLERVKEKVGNIEIVVANELTKVFEKIHRMKISEILLRLEKQKPRGEYVILFNTLLLNKSD